VNVVGFYAAHGRPNVELDELARVEGGMTVHLDGRGVDEDVLVPVFTGDEAVTLFRVEPLHSSGDCHGPLRSAVGCPVSTLRAERRPPTRAYALDRSAGIGGHDPSGGWERRRRALSYMDAMLDRLAGPAVSSPRPGDAGGRT